MVYTINPSTWEPKASLVYRMNSHQPGIHREEAKREGGRDGARERRSERETETETERQRQRQRDRERERQRGKRGSIKLCVYIFATSLFITAKQWSKVANVPLTDIWTKYDNICKYNLTV